MLDDNCPGQKKLVMIIPTMNRKGGAQRVFFNILSGIDKKKFSVTLFVNKYDPALDYEIKGCVKFKSMGINKSRFAIFKIIWEIRKLNPDIVFSTMGYMNLLLLLFKFLIPRKTKVVVRESNTVSEKLKGLPHPLLYKYLYRNFYNKSDRIIAQSRYMRDDLEKNFGVDPDLITVIYNPVNVDKIKELGRADVETNGRQGECTFICIGRLTSQKGYDLLLESLRQVKAPCTVDIFGDGPDRDRLQKRIYDFDLADIVALRGFTKFPFERMREADALLLPSRFEGLPNVVLEAHCLGLPVIAFNGPGGTSEVINVGFNGCLIEVGDFAGFARALDEFGGYRFERDKIATDACQQFCFDNILDQYERLLISL